MFPIVTLTFNPCIDKSFETEVLLPEKKLACSAPRLEPGGGGINVARAVHRLGGIALAVYPSGGYHGALLTELLTAERVPVHPIPMLADIRENVNVRELGANRQYRFITPGARLTTHVWTKCVEAMELVQEKGTLVVSGSLPEGWPADLFQQLKALADRKAAKLVVDSGGKALREALACGVYLIKPSANELNALAMALGLPEGPSAAKVIVNRGWAEVVVASAGADGALLVTRDRVLEIKAPAVRKVSTVGAGDSMVAGFVLGLSHQMDIVEAVRYGVACGTAAVLNPGTGLCRLKDVESLYAQMNDDINILYHANTTSTLSDGDQKRAGQIP